MLILSGLTGEKFHLGDDIVIEITEIRRGRVRLGFTAPKEVLIKRGKHFEKATPDENDSDCSTTAKPVANGGGLPSD